MFYGTIPALITPFTKQLDIDYEVLEGLINWHLDSGVRGFVVLGTTGESPTISKDEKITLIKRVVHIVSGKVPIIVGTGSNCTRTSIEFTRTVKDLGVDGALVVSPYYNKPTQEGLFQHFKSVALEGGLPIVIYNIPGRTSVDISIDTFKRLAELDNIVAVKEASGSADKLIDLSATVGDKINILSGEDSLTYFVMTVGGRGVISASANVIPKEMVMITENALNGKFEESRLAQENALPVIRALFAETNPSPAKAALKMLGKIPEDFLRLPLVPVTEQTKMLLKSVLL
jgi:4-hydroxy-tetrahydrodipicolinate synthase